MFSRLFLQVSSNFLRLQHLLKAYNESRSQKMRRSGRNELKQCTFLEWNKYDRPCVFRYSLTKTGRNYKLSKFWLLQNGHSRSAAVFMEKPSGRRTTVQFGILYEKEGTMLPFHRTTNSSNKTAKNPLMILIWPGWKLPKL